VERGQHQLAVRAVECSVDRQQSVAEQRRQVAQVTLTPEEVLGMRHQYVVVGRRPEHEHGVVVEHLEREDRAVSLIGLEQQPQRVPVESARARHAEAQLSGRPRHLRGAVGADIAPQHPERVRRHRSWCLGHAPSIPAGPYAPEMST
jgi:hypothetical protein